jgi:hypothetical protein
VTLPPRDTLKLFGMAVLALEREGAGQPGMRLVLLRSWRTATLLIKNGDWSEAQLQRLRAFAAQRSFDFGWYPGMTAADADRYNILDRPWFYEGATALLGPERDAFVADYKFDIAPAVDDRPYFFHFFRWRALPELLRLKDQGGLPLLEWGYPLLVATLLQAIVASAALILLPLWLLGRRDRARSREAHRWRVAVYFTAIGLAFMLVEIAFIQKFGLLLGHPLYAIAVVLFAFLLSAGLGSRFAERLLPAGLRITLPVLAIAAVSGLYASLLLPVLLPVVAALPDAARIAIGVALILPLGFAMGMPFPAGLARVAASAERLVPWAWGVNACASVIGAIAATLAAVPPARAPRSPGPAAGGARPARAGRSRSSTPRPARRRSRSACTTPPRCRRWRAGRPPAGRAPPAGSRPRASRCGRRRTRARSPGRRFPPAACLSSAAARSRRPARRRAARR